MRWEERPWEKCSRRIARDSLGDGTPTRGYDQRMGWNGVEGHTGRMAEDRAEDA